MSWVELSMVELGAAARRVADAIERLLASMMAYSYLNDQHSVIGNSCLLPLVYSTAGSRDVYGRKPVSPKDWHGTKLHPGNFYK